MAKVRVLIADDHALVREGISALLSHYDDVTVVGLASDGKEAVQKALELKPDIVLMDIAMPGLGGMEATLEIKKQQPGIKILVLSQYEDKEYVTRFLKAGVSGYIIKKAIGSELIDAIRAVSRGDKYLHPSITANVVESLIEGEEKKEKDPYDLLSDREKQVLKLIAEGETHKEIAESLGISVKTATAHQSNISEKLDLHSKADLIKFAIQRGIIKLEN